MADQKLEGWVEPVHAALMRPPSLFGAAPRGLAIGMYIIAGAFEFLTFAMHTADMVTFLAPVVATAACQVGMAALTHIQPFWFDMAAEWFRSPQQRVDP